MIEKTARICTVEGCGRPQHGQGLCSKHLLRLRRTGTIEPGRPYMQRKGRAETGALLTEHPLYLTWREFRREINPRPVVQEWRDDFEAFIAAVGERPSPAHRLRRVRMGEILGPDNFAWRELLVEKQPGEDQREYQKRAVKAHRMAFPDDYKNSDLRRMYGADFSLDRYREMFEAQKGLCASCGNPEIVLDKNGNLKLLAVDHDHESGAVRSLLCQMCNQGIGFFRDDPVLLEKAATYPALCSKLKNH